MIDVYLVVRTLQINCNPTFILYNFILRLTWDKLVCGNLFSWPSLIHILFVITIIYAKDWLAAKNICDDKSLTKIAKNFLHMYSMHKSQ